MHLNPHLVRTSSILLLTFHFSHAHPTESNLLLFYFPICLGCSIPLPHPPMCILWRREDILIQREGYLLCLFCTSSCWFKVMERFEEKQAEQQWRRNLRVICTCASYEGEHIRKGFHYTEAYRNLWFHGCFGCFSQTR